MLHRLLKTCGQQSAIAVNGLTISITRKRIKNCHLRVCPPHGEVRVTIPLALQDAALHSLIASRLDWIKRQQEKFKNYIVPSSQEMVSGESHYFLGQACVLNIIPGRGVGRVVLRNQNSADSAVLEMHVRESTTKIYRQKLLQSWYREQMLVIVPPLLERWQKELGVQASDWGVKKMKSKWGSCHTRRKNIWLNLELMKAEPRCLEYVLVHELVHLLEPSHNKNFKALMDQFMPGWRLLKTELNKTVVL